MYAKSMCKCVASSVMLCNPIPALNTGEGCYITYLEECLGSNRASRERFMLEGDHISVWDDLWILGNEVDRLQNQDNNKNIKLVSDSIEATNRTWKADVVINTFRMDVAKKIMQIPLAEIAHDDFQVWRVRSAYKLLQETNLDPSSYIIQAERKKFYRKLRKLYIPLKVTITIWRISWNFIPSLVNLKHKKVVVDAQCLRCCQNEEDNSHIFCQCLTIVEVWNHLNLSWVLNNNTQNMNHLLYERRNVTGREIAKQIQSYISELDGIKEKKLTLQSDGGIQQDNRKARVTVHFDAAFDQQSSRLALGLIARNEEGEILASKTIIHFDITIPFTAEAHEGLQAVKLGIFMGLNKLEVVGDSKIVIKKYQSTDIDKSTIGAIIRDIQSKKDRFQEIRFHFTLKQRIHMPMFL
ncbi:glycine, alanine and asparagine-rich protein-like [Gossypium australe]|uniref:Glycine, alanine and asparagine-rich protein-like n=1 Tax=Gossypium australe TaxID=47621 RepID=A0A5B6UWV6_9ROSI|nr:glycine, alanine and asparagine-rich protein-like [Gossypium australe]